MNNRIQILAVHSMLIIALLFIEYRLYSLQIVDHYDLSIMAENQFTGKPEHGVKRGSIYDTDGKKLAFGIKGYSIYVRPDEIEDDLKVSRTLSGILSVPEKKIIDMISRDTPFVWIKRHAGLAAGETVKKMDFKGVYLSEEEDRYYPEGDLAAHIIGFVGTDNQGLSGIEYMFNKELSADQEGLSWKRDALGRMIVPMEYKDTSAGQGDSLVLSINKAVQFIVNKELEKACIENVAKRGIVIVQDVNNGDILALSCFPGFNANDPFRTGRTMYKNPALSDVFEPGSTFKVFVAASLFEESVIDEENNIYCEEGEWIVPGSPIRDHKEHGWLTFRQVMENSSNIGMAKVASKLGYTGLYRYLRDFGFGNFTGIELPGESRGILPKPDRCSEVRFLRISFGQSLGVTAVQMITAFSALVNGGTLYEPHIVKTVKDWRGEIIREYEPFKIRQVVSASTSKRLRDMMGGIVDSGTGRLASVNGLRTGGKTGTAQKVDPETGTYSKEAYIASFMGFFPLDAPRFSILVVIDEPEKDYWGGTVAAPVFSTISEQLAIYYGITDKDEIKFAEAK